MYGVGLPVLFPIAALNLIIFWMLERYAMAFSYQYPPSLDDRLTKNAIAVLKFSPLLLLFNGFWMLTNRQVFKSEVNQRETSTDLMLTGHTFATVWEVDQGTPVMLMCFACTIICFLQSFLKKSLKKWGFSFSNSTL